MVTIFSAKKIIQEQNKKIEDLEKKNNALKDANQKLLERNCELVDTLNGLESNYTQIEPKPYQEIDEKEELLNHAFSAICNLFFAAEKANYSKCGSFHIEPFNTHWEKRTVTEVMEAVKLYVGTWVITPMEEAIKADRENIKNYQLKLIEETKRKRVRWFPTDTDETFDGTVIEEKPNFYVVIPDQNLELTQNWNKKRCNILAD